METELSKYDALEDIRESWNSATLSLGDKIRKISSEFSANGLDLAGTAAYIHATPSELNALLALGDLDDAYIDRISELNPPRTTWTMLATARDEELDGALEAMKRNREANPQDRVKTTFSEYIYTTMMDVSGPTVEQKVANLSGDVILHALKKGEDFKILIAPKEPNFLKSIASRKKRGKVLSEKQVKWLLDILERLVDGGAIVRESIDGDQEICDQILDALDR